MEERIGQRLHRVTTTPPSITQPSHRQMLWQLSTRAYLIWNNNNHPTSIPIPGTLIITAKNMEDHGEEEGEEEAVGECPPGEEEEEPGGEEEEEQ